MLTLTRGEKTGYCESSGFKGYQPALGELPPGNDPTYLTKTCKQNRVGSALAFFAKMCAVDPCLGPMPKQHVVLTGKPLPPGKTDIFKDCLLDSAFPPRPGKGSLCHDGASAGLTTDFFNDPRDAKPDIGAVERHP